MFFFVCCKSADSKIQARIIFNYKKYTFRIHLDYIIFMVHGRATSCDDWPACRLLPGAGAAGWRACVRSALGRWCSCPWCCPAELWWPVWPDWAPERESPPPYTPTTARAPSPDECHSTGSADTVGGATAQSEFSPTNVFEFVRNGVQKTSYGICMEYNQIGLCDKSIHQKSPYWQVIFNILQKLCQKYITII